MFHLKIRLQDLKQRLASHNELSKKGWTVKFRPWQLVHSESFESKVKELNVQYLESSVLSNMLDDL